MTPAQKALILLNAQRAKHRPSKVMGKRAVLLVAKDLTTKRRLRKVINERLAAL